jgi:glycosyltransferase involved in cell wall biosynthesis
MYKEARGIKALLVVPMVISMVFSAVKELRRGANVAYGHWWIPGGVVAVISAGLTRRRSLVHLHGSDSHIAHNRVMQFFARWVLRRADLRLAVSKELAGWGQLVSGREIVVLPMPIALDSTLSPSPVPNDGFILGVGRLVYEKGFDLLIEAVGAIEPANRPKVVIVGGGPERQALIDQADLHNVNLHLPGVISPLHLPEWFSRARIVAVPSRREGFGLVAAEAAAAGRAVVGSAVGGIPDIVKQGVSGLVVEPGDVGALTRALLEVDPSWGTQGPTRVKVLSPSQHGTFVRQLCDDIGL